MPRGSAIGLVGIPLYLLSRRLELSIFLISGSGEKRDYNAEPHSFSSDTTPHNLNDYTFFDIACWFDAVNPIAITALSRKAKAATKGKFFTPKSLVRKLFQPKLACTAP